MYFISRLFTLVDSLLIEGTCVIVLLLVLLLRQDGRCRLIPGYSLCLYTACSNVCFLNVFFLSFAFRIQQTHFVFLQNNLFLTT